MELILLDNMVDDNGLVIFEASIPYPVVKNTMIINENGIGIKIEEIWVEYKIIK